MASYRIWLAPALVALLFLAATLPATHAEPPGLAVGTLGSVSDARALPAQASTKALAASDLTETGLRHMDALVLDASELDGAWASDAKRGVLKGFLADHRAIVVPGDAAALARFGDIAFLDGADAPSDTTLAVTAVGAVRSMGGAWDVAFFGYEDAETRDAELAGDTGRWLQALPHYEPQRGNSFTARAADNGNWQYMGSASYSYTWNPYGKIAYVARFYQAIDDESTSYDWWNVQMTQATYPGTYLYANDWYTNVGWITGDQDYYHNSHELVDWGPGSGDYSGSVETLSWETGMEDGVEGATITSKRSFAYTVDDAVVTQSSSSSDESVYVRHDFGYDSGPASGVWAHKPSWSVRTTDAGCLKVPFTNKVEWHDYVAVSYYTTWIDSWREVCP